MAGFNFDVAMLVGLFLIAVWSVGRLFARMKLPPLVGQMLVGVLLGPQGMDLVPYASNGACQAYSPAFLPAPDAALLLNSTGSGSTPCGSKRRPRRPLGANKGRPHTDQVSCAGPGFNTRRWGPATSTVKISVQMAFGFSCFVASLCTLRPGVSSR